MSVAWESRGQGWAASVAAEGWKGFETNSAKGWQLGEEAIRSRMEDPALYDVMLALGVGLNKPRSELESLFEKGTALDPGFDHLYVVMARHLMPRWNGTSEDFEAFASRASHRTKDKLGDVLYARVAAEGLLLYSGGDFLQLSPKIPWERLRSAFRDLDKAFPNSSFNVDAFCALAVRYGDVATARSLFARIGDGGSGDATEVWGTRARFEAARASIEKAAP